MNCIGTTKTGAGLTRAAAEHAMTEVLRLLFEGGSGSRLAVVAPGMATSACFVLSSELL
jgi:hypothetical protein